MVGLPRDDCWYQQLSSSQVQLFAVVGTSNISLHVAINQPKPSVTSYYKASWNVPTSSSIRTKPQTHFNGVQECICDENFDPNFLAHSLAVHGGHHLLVHLSQVLANRPTSHPVHVNR